MSPAPVSPPPAEAIAGAFDPQRMFDYPDPYPLFAAMRCHVPVVPITLPGRQLSAVTRWADVRAVLGDPTTYVQPSIQRVIFGQSRRARAARHAVARTIAARLFTPHAVARLRPRVEAVAHRLLDEIGGRTQADLVATYLDLLPVVIVAELIGIPSADHARFLGWSHDIIGIGRDPRRGTASAQALDRYLTPIVRARRAAPRDDVISHLATAALHGQGLSEAEVVGFLRVLIPAAADPPAQMLGSLLVALLGERERFERLGAERALVPSAVTEALRWEAPIVYVIRQATRPTRLGGTAVEAGTDLCLVVGSANRDEALHDAPDRFDLDRRVEEHLSFGYGRHYCLGSHLAVLIGRVGLEALLDRLPRLRLDPAAPPPAIVGFAFRRPPSLPVRLD